MYVEKNVIEQVKIYNQIPRLAGSQGGCFLLKLFLLKEQWALELPFSRKDVNASL